MDKESFYLTVNDYLEENDLDYNDVIMKSEDGKLITPGTLIQFCTVLKVEGNVLTIR